MTIAHMVLWKKGNKRIYMHIRFEKYKHFNCWASSHKEMFNIGYYRKINEVVTILIEDELYKKDHWMFLYKVHIFYADHMSNMATTAGKY
jgi:hypothetical protein